MKENHHSCSGLSRETATRIGAVSYCPTRSLLLAISVNVVNGLLNCRDLFSLFVWYFCFEFVFERHHELDQDRKSTRLNSSHVAISYAVFCLKKKKKRIIKSKPV